MREKNRIGSKGLRIAGIAAIVLVLIGAYGALGSARATHSSCGTYCWNEVAPYTADGAPYTVSGGGSYSLDVQSDDTNGQMTTTQSSSASYAEQEILYAEPWIEGNPIVFYTPVGVTLTFSTYIEASYSVSGWCLLEGEWIGQVEIYVTVGFAGTSYTSTSIFMEEPAADVCDILSPHGGAASATEKLMAISGDPSGTLTQTVAVDVPSGTYTPFVQIFAETYFESIGASGGTASLNMQTGGNYAQWNSVNLNWGPGEG